MWLVKKQYNPLSSLFDRDMFDDFFSDVFQHQLRPQQHYPALELGETEKQVNVSVALAGYDKKDIHIDYKDGYLAIKAEKNLSKKDKDESIHYSELAANTLTRQVYVGEINFDKAKAHLKNGLLLIELPKIEAVKAARLEIE